MPSQLRSELIGQSELRLAFWIWTWKLFFLRCMYRTNKLVKKSLWNRAGGAIWIFAAEGSTFFQLVRYSYLIIQLEFPITYKSTSITVPFQERTFEFARSILIFEAIISAALRYKYLVLTASIAGPPGTLDGEILQRWTEKAKTSRILTVAETRANSLWRCVRKTNGNRRPRRVQIVR